MANALDELKENIESAIADAERDIKHLEDRGRMLDRPQQIADAINVNLDVATSQSKVFKTTLRSFALKKIEKEGAMVLMLRPEEKEAYKKFSRIDKIASLKKRLERAMEKAQTERSELFNAGAGGNEMNPMTSAERLAADDRDVESGKLSAGKVWERTDEVQNRTLDTVGKAITVANDTDEIAQQALREQQRQLELTHKIRTEVKDLNERYGISFSIMGTILRQIACDGCFQALFAVLILAIIAFLIVKYM